MERGDGCGRSHQEGCAWSRRGLWTSPAGGLRAVLGWGGGTGWQLVCGGLGFWDPHLVPECCRLGICCSPELGLNCCPSLAFQEGDV